MLTHDCLYNALVNFRIEASQGGWTLSVNRKELFDVALTVQLLIGS